MGCGQSTAVETAPPLRTEFQKRMAMLAAPSDNSDKPSEPDVQFLDGEQSLLSRVRAVENDELEMQQKEVRGSFRVESGDLLAMLGQSPKQEVSAATPAVGAEVP